MSEEGPLKSAYELAMERLKKKDKEEGVEEDRPLTEREKAEITELRQNARAKLAEMEILHRKALSGVEPDKIAEIEEKYRTDRARVESRLESAVAKVRRGEAD
jgi:ABC-type microcin C transport system permease subunit YejB